MANPLGQMPLHAPHCKQSLSRSPWGTASRTLLKNVRPPLVETVVATVVTGHLPAKRNTPFALPSQANNLRRVWSMSGPEGHDPPHVPHCRQVISVSAPGVVAMTSAMKLSP